jgi:hypothetical protein
MPTPGANALHSREETETMIFDRNIDIPLRDGLGLLRGNLYRPIAPGRYPVLVTCEFFLMTLRTVGYIDLKLLRCSCSPQMDLMARISLTPTLMPNLSERSPTSKSRNTRLGRSPNLLIGPDTDTPSCASTSGVSGARSDSSTPCRIRPARISQKSSNGLPINPGRPARLASWESRKLWQVQISRFHQLTMISLQFRPDTTAGVSGESQRASPRDSPVLFPGRVRKNDLLVDSFQRFSRLTYTRKPCPFFRNDRLLSRPCQAWRHLLEQVCLVLVEQPSQADAVW